MANECRRVCGPTLFWIPALRAAFFAGKINRFGRQVSAIRSLLGLAWEKIYTGFFPSPVLSQSLQKLKAERDVTIFTTFSFLDMNDHSLAIDVADLKPDNFCASNPGRI